MWAKTKPVSAGRENQHARRVRYPETQRYTLAVIESFNETRFYFQDRLPGITAK
jgi:hypothetical protein